MEKKKFLRTKSVPILLLFMLVNVLVGCIFFYLYFIKVIKIESVLIFITIFLFIIISIILNELTRRMVDNKFKPKYTEKSYDIQSIDKIKEILNNRKANKMELSYATSYLLIDKDVAYKILIVNDNEQYFKSSEVKENNKPNKQLEKCTKFYGIELFLNVDDETISKLQQYTFQAQKIYYTAMYLNNNTLIQPHYELPNEHHKDNYDFIINLLEMKANDSKQTI
ncbi:MAG: hypothetical protein R3Y05_00565 [bacterium]